MFGGKSIYIIDNKDNKSAISNNENNFFGAYENQSSTYSFGGSSESIFDPRNNANTETNNFGSSSSMAELNVRESNQNNLSVIDRMRGIEGKRLDNSAEISLAEQYNDSKLDRRIMNGAYNITISDTYKNEALFKAVHGLYTDGMVSSNTDKTTKEKDFLNLFNEQNNTSNPLNDNNLKEDKKELERRSIFNSEMYSKKEDNEEELTEEERRKKELERRSIFNSEMYSKKEDNEEELTEEERREELEKILAISQGKKINTKSEKKKNNLIGKDKNSIFNYEENKPAKKENEKILNLTKMETNRGKRAKLQEDLYIKAKELNEKHKTQVVTAEELKIAENGGEKPNVLKSYSELKEISKKIIDKLNNKNIDKKEIIILEKELKTIKFFMLKKVLEG